MDILPNPSAPPLLIPSKKIAVRNLLVEAGHNTDYWAKTRNGQMANPNTNTHWARQWSFVDRDGRPDVFCFWDFQIDKKSTNPVVIRGNTQAWVEQEYAKGGNNVKHRTAPAFDLMSRLQKAQRERTPVQVIIVTPRSRAGEETDQGDDEKVEYRGLDKAYWWVHEYDIYTHDYKLVRNEIPPPEVEPAEPLDDPAADPMSDPMLDAYLDSLDVTVRDAVAKARVGQGLFRERLIDRWGSACAVTGVRGKDFLVASHILRWSECETAKDRLAAANGLLLIPNFDRLFDQHWISFDDRGRMLISPALPWKLESPFARELGLRPNMRLREWFDDMEPYMARHRANLRKA